MSNEPLLDLLLIGVILYWLQPQRFILGKIYGLRTQLKEFRDKAQGQLALNSDILKKNTSELLTSAISKSEELLKNNADANEIESFLKDDANKALNSLPKYPQQKIRENLEVILVAFTLAFAFRALFFQPFKIPTGSMQPTLYGVEVWEQTSNNRETLELKSPDSKIRRILHSIYYGRSYFDFSVPQTGFFFQGDLKLDNGYTKRVYGFSPNGVDREFMENLSPSQVLKTGQGIPVLTDASVLSFPEAPIFYPAKAQYFAESLGLNSNTPEVSVTSDQKFNGFIETGDHLLVNRLTYRFREPKRGDISVFETKGITYTNGQGLAGQFYIKRLAGLPGDTLRIIDQNQLQIKTPGSTEFVNIQTLEPDNYTNLYSGLGDYHGHLPEGNLAAGQEFTVPENMFYMLGDNSANSADSRYWGCVPRANLSGTASFVFWPLSRRWGVADHEAPHSWKTPPKFYQ